MKQLIFLFLFIHQLHGIYAQSMNNKTNSRFIVKIKSSKKGVYDSKQKKFIVPANYDEITQFNWDNLYYVAYNKDTFTNEERYNYYLIESNNNLLELFEINGEIIVKNNKRKYGFAEGDPRIGYIKLVSKIEFDTILFYSKFDINEDRNHYIYPYYRKRYALFLKDSIFFIYNLNSYSRDSTAILVEFDEKSPHIQDGKLRIVNLPNSNYEFNSSYFIFDFIKVKRVTNDIVKYNNKYGLFDFKSGNFYLPTEYDSIIPKDDYYEFYKNRKKGFATWKSNSTYEILTADSGYEDVLKIGWHSFFFKVNGRWVKKLTDTTTYDSLCYFEDIQMTVSKVNNKWAIENRYNNNRNSSARIVGIKVFIFPKYGKKIKPIKYSFNDYQTKSYHVWDSIFCRNSNLLAYKNNQLYLLDAYRNREYKIKLKKFKYIHYEKTEFRGDYIPFVTFRRLDDSYLSYILYDGQLIVTKNEYVDDEIYKCYKRNGGK